jgi:hypothetical protein
VVTIGNLVKQEQRCNKYRKNRVMSFHNRQPHFLVKTLVTFTKRAVAYTSETNFLGIRITDTLKLPSHIQLLANKLSRVAFDVITSLVSMEHGVYGCEKVTSLREVTSNGLA